MAVLINRETCVGCGICVDACPFAAIEMAEGKAVIGPACTQCGACVDKCPVGAITRSAEEKAEAKDLSDYKDVWVYIEVYQNEIKNVSLELMGQGRLLADKLGQRLVAVLIGSGTAQHAATAGRYGADEVLAVEGEEYARYNTDAYAFALTELVGRYKPSVMMLGATNNGRDLGPRVACRLKTGLTADCTALDINTEKQLVAWTRPAFGGNIMATIFCPNTRPQIGTVRPNVFKKPAASGQAAPVTTISDIHMPAEKMRANIIEFIAADLSEKVNLEEADVIVSGGRGLKNAENFKLVRELADALGGVVGASRGAVDAGWIPAAHQVGQTGTTVGPSLYIACGISGAIQHVAGMSSSDIIVAVNKDPRAPIFDIAHYCVVGDLFDVLPALTKEVKARKAARRGEGG